MKRDPEKARAWAARAKPMKRTARLAPRSAKRAREYAEPVTGRRDLVAATLAARPRCEARVLCRGARAVDVHERLTRARGGSILDLDQSHAITVCRRCHDWIGREVAQATARRLLLPSWHRCPPVGPC